MRCPNCSYTSDQDFTYCPSCGQAYLAASDKQQEQPAQDRPAADSATGSGPAQNTAAPGGPQQDRAAYTRSDYNPSRDGHWPSHVLNNTAGTAASDQPRPSSTSMIVMSIINMLCCGLGISMILGIIGLVFAILAGNEATAAEAAKKLKTARILNIIGLVFIVLQLVFFVVIIICSVFWASEFATYSNFGSFRDSFPSLPVN
ncbi:MAG: hypothetical protein VB070_15520 [Clostridiaceae bacterium]|nr:hypothetical protein [Clostridiaceae bacterium]